MNTLKQVIKAFGVMRASGLKYNRKDDLYYNVYFLINGNWIRMDRDTINILQTF